MTIACAAILFGAVEDIRVLQKACDGGNTISCDYVGFLYDNGLAIWEMQWAAIHSGFYTLKVEA